MEQRSIVLSKDRIAVITYEAPSIYFDMGGRLVKGSTVCKLVSNLNGDPIPEKDRSKWAHDEDLFSMFADEEGFDKVKIGYRLTPTGFKILMPKYVDHAPYISADDMKLIQAEWHDIESKPVLLHEIYS